MTPSLDVFHLCKLLDQQLLRGEIGPKIPIPFLRTASSSRKYEGVSFSGGSSPSAIVFAQYNQVHNIPWGSCYYLWLWYMNIYFLGICLNIEKRRKQSHRAVSNGMVRPRTEQCFMCGWWQIECLSRFKLNHLMFLGTNQERPYLTSGRH